VAPVRSMSRALDGAEVAARGMLASYEHPSLGSVRSVGSPLKVSDFDPHYSAAPRYHSDRDAILTEIGLDRVAVRALDEEGAFGTPSVPPAQVQPAT
jgi:crotonobetainyl-CoA:carnitine CoA-transferase CaiB-like acyl-CoA transferase